MHSLQEHLVVVSSVSIACPTERENRIVASRMPLAEGAKGRHVVMHVFGSISRVLASLSDPLCLKSLKRETLG